MAKLRGTRLETEIDRCRIEQNWDRLNNELIPLVVSRGSGHEHLGDFLRGEYLVESFVDMFGVFPAPDKRFRDNEALAKAKDHLSHIKESHVNAEYFLSTQLLLAKICYVTAHFKDAIEAINVSGLEKEEVKWQSLRTIRLIAEAYAIRGLCQEHVASKAVTKFQKHQRIDQIISSFEKAAEVVIFYLQELDKFTAATVSYTVVPLQTQQSAVSAASTTSATSITTTATQLSTGQPRQDSLGRLLETAVQRIPIMEIQRDQRRWRKEQREIDRQKRSFSPLSQSRPVDDSTKLTVESPNVSVDNSPSQYSSADCLRRSLEKYRHFLRLVDRRLSQHLQENLSRQLAELLLRGVPNESYVVPVSTVASHQSQLLSAPSGLLASASTASLSGSNTGRLCKHQSAVILKYSFQPTINAISSSSPLRYLLYRVATGQEAPSGYLDPIGAKPAESLPDEPTTSATDSLASQSSSNSPDDITTHDCGSFGSSNIDLQALESKFSVITDYCMQRLQSDPDIFASAISSFVSNFDKLSSDNSLVSALHTFGKYGNACGKKKIPVNVTGRMRRKHYHRGNVQALAGRPRLDREEPLTDYSDEPLLPSKKQKSAKPPHSIIGSGSTPVAQSTAVTPVGTMNIRLMLERQQQRELTFVPQNRLEETLLALLISDSIVCREAVLSRAIEHAETRSSSLKSVKASLNLLILGLSSLRQYQLLVDVFERALKLAFDDFYLWLQFGLTLMCNGLFTRSSLFLKEYLKMCEQHGFVSASDRHQSVSLKQGRSKSAHFHRDAHSVTPWLLLQLSKTQEFVSQVKKFFEDSGDEETGVEDGLFKKPKSPSTTTVSIGSPSGMLLDCSTAYLFAAKLHIEHLGQYKEAICLAEAAIRVSHGGWLTTRAHLLLGVAYSFLAEKQFGYGDRKLLEKKAEQSFRNAIQFDQKDHLARFFLGLQYAFSRNNVDARKHCEEALRLHPYHASSVLLMALLLTAEQAFDEALDLVSEALDEHPNNFGFLVLQLKLQMRQEKSDKALRSAKELLWFWKREMMCASTVHAFSCKSGGLSSELLQHLAAGSRRATPATGSEFNTIHSKDGLAKIAEDGQSVRMSKLSDLAERESIGASVLGVVSELGPAMSSISDSAGLTGSSLQRQALISLWKLQANIWLELAEVFLDCNKLDEVEYCVEEAIGTFQNSHQALYVKGRLFVKQGLYTQAKSCFQSALALLPSHVPSLRQLALLYQDERNLRMAKKTLSDIVRTDPLDHASWFALGQVLIQSGEPEQAANCFLTAFNLEQTAPLLPYAIVPRIIA